jgi:serine/threonine-protein kinase 24/25/MST4
MKEGDIGDGYVRSQLSKVTCSCVRFSTVRPVKNVDKTRTSRLSTDFLVSSSVRRQSAPQEIVPPTPRRQPVSEKGRAGEVLVEEVILGVLDSVSFSIPLLGDS